MLTILVWLFGVAAASAQQADGTGTDSEIDRFMERVLDNRDAAWRRLGDFLLRETETFEIAAPLGVPLSGFRREYEWFVRDDGIVRSPLRYDGVDIDAADRRRYEEEWLRRERRSRGRWGNRGRTLSRRTSADNIAITIEREWGAPVSGRLGNRIAADAGWLDDDLAAIALNTGAILDALGGVEEVGFAEAVDRTRVLFVMLDTGRLSPAEVTRALRRPLLALVDGLDPPALDDDQIAGFVELAELAAHFALDARDLDTYFGRAARRLEATHPGPAAALDRFRGALEARDDAAGAPGDPVREPEDSLLDAGRIEPRFISESYFMEFIFEPGNYYFVGRETLAGREVVRLEYYPTDLFDDASDEDPSEIEARIDRGFNKTSLITLWVDPEQEQIVKYTFENTGLDFLPGRWLVQVEGLSATMEMGQPLGDVWLPLRVRVSGRAATALGDFDLRFTREFLDYREVETGGRIVEVEAPR